MKRAFLPFICSLALIFTGSHIWAAVPQQRPAAPTAAALKAQLDQITRQAEDSLQLAVKSAYIGYLGLKPNDLLPNQQLLDHAETMFSDLNHLLETDVEPIIHRGKQLAEIYSQKAQDRSYLDRFTLQELRVKGLVSSNAEDYERGRRNLEQAVIQAKSIDEKKGMAYALNNLSYCYFHLKRGEDAVKSQRQAVEWAEKSGDPSALSLFVYNLGWIYLNSRQLDAAVPLFQRAAQISEQAHIPVRQVASLLNLASIQLFQGQLQSARHNLALSQEMSARINSLRLRVLSGYDTAVLLAMSDQYAECAARLREVVGLLDQHGSKVFMDGETAFLRQKVALLAQHLEEKTPGAGPPIDSASAAEITKPVHLHSHFSHMAALVPFGETFEATSPAQRPRTKQSAPAAPENKDAVRVTMKSATTPPNSSFTTPVYLSTPANTKLSSIILEVAYPKDAFSFSKAEKSFQIQSGPYTVDTKTSAHATDKRKEMLTISVSAGEEEGRKLALPNGLILYLSFTVPKKTPHHVVQLQNKLVKAETIDGSTVPKELLAAENQSVNILGPGMVPVTLCFFYIH